MVKPVSKWSDQELDDRTRDTTLWPVERQEAHDEIVRRKIAQHEDAGGEGEHGE
jgi:hypothetical protein